MLRKVSVYVFCVVADNAKSFQKALNSFQTQGIESEDEESAEIVEGEEENWQLMDAVLQSLATKGIFCVRCAAHSLQLVRHIVGFFFTQVIHTGFEGYGKRNSNCPIGC